VHGSNHGSTTSRRSAPWALALSAALSLAAASAHAGDAPPPKPLPPLRQETPLVVAVLEDPPYAVQAKDGSWSGLGVEMWRAVAGELHVPFVLTPFDEGQPFLSEITRFDVYPTLSVRLRNEEQRDLTHAYVVESFAIAVRNEKQTVVDVAIDAGRKVLSWTFLEALGAVAAILAAMGTLVWWIERRNIPEEFGGPPARGIAAGVVWTIEALAGKARSLSHTPRSRAFNLVWALASVVFISGFTAKMSAELTVSQLDSRIAGPEDLPRFRVGTTGSLATDYLLARGVRTTTFPTKRELIEALLSRRVDAIVSAESGLRYYEKHDYAGRLRVLPTTFHRYGMAMALRPGSPLMPHVNRAMLRYVQSVEWQRAQADLVGSAN
jgi:polar amino acid transport system substrate-binding protein